MTTGSGEVNAVIEQMFFSLTVGQEKGFYLLVGNTVTPPFSHQMHQLSVRTRYLNSCPELRNMTVETGRCDPNKCILQILSYMKIEKGRKKYPTHMHP